jgi:hypothetical protein
MTGSAGRVDGRHLLALHELVDHAALRHAEAIAGELDVAERQGQIRGGVVDAFARQARHLAGERAAVRDTRAHAE